MLLSADRFTRFHLRHFFLKHHVFLLFLNPTIIWLTSFSLLLSSQAIHYNFHLNLVFFESVQSWLKTQFPLWPRSVSGMILKLFCSFLVGVRFLMTLDFGIFKCSFLTKRTNSFLSNPFLLFPVAIFGEASSQTIQSQIPYDIFTFSYYYR